MTHVNYSLEEIEAMIEVGQMDEVDKKQDTKEQRMMFIAFGKQNRGFLILLNVYSAAPDLLLFHDGRARTLYFPPPSAHFRRKENNYRRSCKNKRAKVICCWFCCSCFYWTVQVCWKSIAAPWRPEIYSKTKSTWSEQFCTVERYWDIIYLYRIQFIMISCWRWYVFSGDSRLWGEI